MKILVTGAGALLGQGIIKSLRMAKARYHIVAVDPNPHGVGLYWADRAYLIPHAADSSYLDRIGVILDREHPDAVLVGTDVELTTFSKHRAELEVRYQTHIIVSPPEVIRTADDKWLTSEFLRSNGFPHPVSVLPSHTDELIVARGFPLIVKPRHGARSVGMRIVRDESELDVALKMTADPVIQECVGTPTDEYTSGILMTEEGVHSIVTMRRDLRDGNTYRAFVEPDSSFNPFLCEVARALQGRGPLNFQFRVEKGIPKIFEINARFSGTTPLRAYAGFNEVDNIVRHIVLGDPIPSVSLQKVVILRYWEEIVVDPAALQMISPEEPSDALSFSLPFSPSRDREFGSLDSTRSSDGSSPHRDR